MLIRSFPEHAVPPCHLCLFPGSQNLDAHTTGALPAAWDPPACTFAQDGPYKPQSWRTSLEMPEGSSAKKLALTLTFPSDATKTVLPLLFVSGFMMSASDYVPYATRLASHGYFVVQHDTGRLVADKEECGYARVIREALPSLAAQAPGTRRLTQWLGHSRLLGGVRTDGQCRL